MECKKCGKEIQEGEKFCSNCGANTSQKSPKKKIVIISVIAIICVIAVAVAIYLIKTSHTSIETGSSDVELKQSENTQGNGTSSTSFANLKADDKSFDKTQKAIIDYFDNNYFEFGIALSQQYPQIFKGAKVTTNAVIVKVLKSTDDEFQVVAVQGGSLAADVWTGESSVYDAGYR